MKRYIKYIFPVAITILVTLLFVLGVIVYKDRSKRAVNVLVTNRTDSGFTITWTSNSKEKGEVIVVKKGKSFGLLPGLFKKRFYDDRDIEQNNKGEWVLKSTGSQKRHTHHVTIRGLEPDSDYKFKIMGKLFGVRLEDGIVAEARTQRVSDNIRTPDPAYGKVLDTKLEGREDIIIYANLFEYNESEDKETNISNTISTYTNSDGGYVIDLNNFYDLDGEKYDIRDNTILKVMTINHKNSYANKFKLENYKPLPSIIFEDDDREIVTNGIYNKVYAQTQDTSDVVFQGYCGPCVGDKNGDGLYDTDDSGNLINYSCPQYKLCERGCSECNQSGGRTTQSMEPAQVVESEIVQERFPRLLERNSWEEIDAGRSGNQEVCSDNIGVGSTINLPCSRGYNQYWTGGSGNCNICNSRDGKSFQRAHCGPCTASELSNAIIERQGDGDSLTVNSRDPNDDDIREILRDGSKFCQVDDNNCNVSGSTSICHCSLDINVQESYRKDYRVSNTFLYEYFSSSCPVFCQSLPKDANFNPETVRGRNIPSDRDGGLVQRPKIVRVDGPGIEGEYKTIYIEVDLCQYDSKTYNLPCRVSTGNEDNVSLGVLGNGTCFIPEGKNIGDFSSCIVSDLDEIDRQVAEDLGRKTGEDKSNICERLQTGDSNKYLKTKSASSSDGYIITKVGCQFCQDNKLMQIGLNGPFSVVNGNNGINCGQCRKDIYGISRCIVKKDGNEVDDIPNDISYNILGLVKAEGNNVKQDYLEVSESGKYVIYSGNNFEQPLSEFTIDTGDGKAKIKLFIDENGNGLRDEGEPVIKDYAQLKLKKESEAVVWNLESGWNLISIPMISNEGITTASKLLDRFNTQGADVKHIARYTDRGFEMYTKREGNVEFSNDFNLVPGHGYFVLNHRRADVSLTGNKFDTNVPFSTRNGWNLVGIYINGEKRVASDILKKMETEGIKVDIMSRYDSGRYDTIVYENSTLYGNDYNIVEKQGYFIRVKEGGGKKFTP